MTTVTPSSIHLEQLAAQHAWQVFRHPNREVDDSGLDARMSAGAFLDVALTAWKQEDSAAGPMLSARVDGPDAPAAVLQFAVAEAVTLSLAGPSSRPQLDYTVAGRVACVWQSGGVWLELWCRDTQTTVRPEPAPARPSRLRTLLGPGARLPFTRRATTPKETPAT
jgi:hypothetical protein